MFGTKLIQIFTLIGAAQGFILGISILKKGQREISNVLIALVLLVISIRLSIYPFIEIFDFPIWKYITAFSLILLLLIGPAMYLFIRLRLFTDKRLNIVHMFHLIPICVYMLHSIFPLLWLPMCYSYATLFMGIFYGLLSLITISIFNSNISKKSIWEVSDRSKLYSFALPLLLIPVAILILVNYSRPYLGFHPATIPYLALTCGLYRMSFKSTLNSKYLSNTVLSFGSKQKVEIDSDKLSELVSIVENEQLYLDNALNIQKLSLRTKFSRHEISQLLNNGLGKNYNDFINNYRIEASKVKLVDSQFQHLTIEGIAIECGFNSKSTFNQFFKSQTSLTPSEYQRRFITKLSN